MHKSTRNGRRYKTKETVQWEKDARDQVSRHAFKLEALREEFNPSKHIIKTNYTFYLPKEKLLTKQNMVSKTSSDVDNLIKPVNDIIFDMACINDAFVYKVTAQKFPCIGTKIDVGITLVNMNDIDEYRHNLRKKV